MNQDYNENAFDLYFDLYDKGLIERKQMAKELAEFVPVQINKAAEEARKKSARIEHARRNTEVLLRGLGGFIHDQQPENAKIKESLRTKLSENLAIMSEVKDL